MVRVIGRNVVAAVGLFLALLAWPARSQAQFTGKAGAITVNLTIPEGVTKLRGVLAFTATGLGPNMASGADFQELAKRLSVGMVTIKGADEFNDPSYPTRCAKGEFKWLLDAIADAAKASNHPELTHAPIAGHGHSHGGDYWNYFNACYPERMALVFCKASGGVQYSKGALRTPMVWETGTNDLKNSGGNFRAAMMSHRELGTQMALVLGPGETHGGFTPGSRQMVIDLIEGIYNLRVPAEVDASAGPITLFDIDESSGRYWLGDNYTKEIGAYGGFAGKDAIFKTSFLPNEEVAKKWKAYGAMVPTSITIDKGRCVSCYKPLADEPAAKPINAAPAPGGASPADAGVADPKPAPSTGSGAPDASPSPPSPVEPTPPSSGSGGSSPTPPTSPAPPSTTPPPKTPAGSGGSAGSSDEVASSFGGCTMGAGHGVTSGALSLLAGLALAFAAVATRRRR